jgi:hypothetical protein
MLEYDDGQESRKKITQDYYVRYYGVNNSYKIFRLAGGKNEADLNSSILEPRRVNSDLNSNYIACSVDNVRRILVGHIKAFDERRLI